MDKVAFSNNVLVEKYRPTDFNDIVLDPINQTIFANIIESSNFPNLLFYGPPGTGKTTTIINLISSYSEKHYGKKYSPMHLNASDERGIDTIRNQISYYVDSKSSHMKFVILDEVDYMTKSAQQALRYLLWDNKSVRFCLICNYISKIDEGLQNEFIKIRFNQLPQQDIIGFLRKINTCENLQISDEILYKIQGLYKSDIRSMINYMQTNYQNIKVINYEELFNSCPITATKIEEFSIIYGQDQKTIIKELFDYIIRNCLTNIPPLEVINFLNAVENIVHFEDCKISYYVSYSLQIINNHSSKCR